MTWSIVARDASGAFGVAVASRFFAVGALCPGARSGTGAVSTQALVNPPPFNPTRKQSVLDWVKGRAARELTKGA